MRTALWISLGILVVVALVVVGLAAGWAVWGRRLWAGAPSYAPERDAAIDDCGWGYGGVRGMMPGSRPCVAPGTGSGASGELTIDEAHDAVERYLGSLGYAELEVVEVMEFEHNFYAIAREHDTGIGAMELLVDKETSAVGPEIGPNMMWNARYGMHGRSGMMGGSTAINTISATDAAAIAQRWLDTHRPGVTVQEHADPFYGYYTIHTLKDGEIEGMLSVHGTTGQVWYHSWHGAFVQMIETEDSH